MANIIEQRHILRTVFSRVRNHTDLGGDSHRWSCDVCGDSARDRRKARFYVGRKDNNLLCHCHNCGFSGSLLSYLRVSHPDLAEKLSVKSFVTSAAPTMVDCDSLISRLPESVLRHLFSLSWLRDNKESIRKNSFIKLYNILKKVTNTKV